MQNTMIGYVKSTYDIQESSNCIVERSLIIDLNNVGHSLLIFTFQWNIKLASIHIMVL